MKIKRLKNSLSDPSKYIEPISEISKNGDTPLVNSKVEAINFDKIKDDYFDEKCPDYPSTSNDAIIDYDDMDYFVEFKDVASLKNLKKEVYQKIRDSMLIYLDLVDDTLANVKDNLGYILVYNPNKNTDSYNKLKNNVKFLAGPFERDGLSLKQNCQGLYFKNVYCMFAEEFKREIESE